MRIEKFSLIFLPFDNIFRLQSKVYKQYFFFMAAIIWNKSLSVKINSIDEQHVVLIEMINDFYENISNSSNNENISRLISGMKSDTLMNFREEERYMKLFK